MQGVSFGWRQPARLGVKSTPPKGDVRDAAGVVARSVMHSCGNPPTQPHVIIAPPSLMARLKINDRDGFHTSSAEDISIAPRCVCRVFYSCGTSNATGDVDRLSPRYLAARPGRPHRHSSTSAGQPQSGPLISALSQL